ncbi:uncharacterized protein KGF55_001714 [Candida pseudojiufengensis]|uniref:uncharacterized protein n=1 Tax=Candida pseudojiufengensis TaxID=497109 RepID=UPI0022254854|nr:uncharacterized protein KGF55_001714 [Candida pseudojiufengensis]KAI5964645.1 hypothetical protein KGF55_001714 [Candida pseudojiufengensis]
MPRVIVVGGPAGTGKTTQGELLAKNFNCPFIEGDALHPKENIDKMSRGEPLTDEDRWGWLKKLSQVASEKAIEDESKIAVVSCSMLKKSYRDFIKQNSIGENLTFRFVFLYTTFEELMKRVGSRKGHFMKSDMVKSQYDIMEIPKTNELLKNGGESASIDTTNKSPDVIEKEILSNLNS